MGMDAGKIELLLKVHEKNIAALQNSVDSLRKNADPGLSKRVGNLEEGLKDLEKRFSKLLITVSTMTENAAKSAKHEIAEIEKDLHSKYVDKEFVKDQLQKFHSGYSQKLHEIQQQEVKNQQASFAKFQAEQKAIADAGLKESRRSIKQAAMAEFKAMLEARLHLIEAQVKVLLSKPH